METWSSVEAALDAAIERDDMAVVGQIMTGESARLVAANNRLCELIAAAPHGPPAPDEPPSATTAAITSWIRAVLAENGVLATHAAQMLPLYEEIAEHSANVAVALRAVLADESASRVGRVDESASRIGARLENGPPLQRMDDAADRCIGVPVETGPDVVRVCAMEGQIQ